MAPKAPKESQQQQQQPPQHQITVVLPGDDVTKYLPTKYRLGMGLERVGDGNGENETNHTNNSNKSNSNAASSPGISIRATLAGRLHHHHDTWFVWINTKRYRPVLEDRVVGIVQDRLGSDGATGADVYRVDVGGPHTCGLSSLKFEGATKRNRPQLLPGTLVYARVTSVGEVSDPVLSCMLGPKDQGMARRDWMTEEAAYGELKGGTLQKIPLGLARALLSPTNVVLEELAKLPFEVAIGVNGFLWIHALRPEYTILVRNAILNSQVLTEEQTRAMVRSLMETVKQQMEEDDEMQEDADEGDVVQQEEDQ